MTHKRQQIREALATALASGVTLVSGRVFQSRVRNLWSDDSLPCLLVYTRNESVEKAIDAPVRLRRTVSVVVECVAKADDNLDDALDAITEQVETVVAANQYDAALDAEYMLGDTDVVLTGEGDAMHGRAAVTVTATYYQDFPDDLTGDLDNLSSIHADWNLENQQPAADESQDVVTFNALRLQSGGLLRLQSGGALHVEAP